MAINKVILLGNVGNDPEIRESAGGKFATFRLATTDRAYQRKDGTQVPERTEWHSIVVNGNIVSVVENYVRKGSKLYIEGKLRTRKYTDRNNVERYATEIHLENLELLSAKTEQTEQSTVPPFYNQERAQQAQSTPLPRTEYNDLPWDKPPF